MSKKLHNQIKFEKVLIDLISSGLHQDKDRLELLAVTLSRILKDDYPETAKEINQIIGKYSMNGKSTRGMHASPVPVDAETQMEIANVILPNKEQSLPPVLNSAIQEKIHNFLQERENITLLLDKNIRPTTSLLVVGPPGTGKTMLAHYIASELKKNLVVLDLAASISSLLGKTGYNLKKVLNYAKQTSSVLLLDEFDAIAKRRDDPTDLGELKRVVNVLLMELETWPISSIVIATSNHPGLLDKAIWRRFDHTIEINLPEQPERLQLLQNSLKDFLKNSSHGYSILSPVADLLEGYSAADICKFGEQVKRRIVLKKEDALFATLSELSLFTNDKEAKGKFCKLAKDYLKDTITVRDLADMTGLSPSGVQYHLARK